jgi:hypothetical protein
VAITVAFLEHALAAESRDDKIQKIQKMNGEIDNLAGLEACIGRAPAAMHVKVIDHIDAGAQRWLAASPLMFAGFGTREGITISLGGGEPRCLGWHCQCQLRFTSWLHRAWPPTTDQPLAQA